MKISIFGNRNRDEIRILTQHIKVQDNLEKGLRVKLSRFFRARLREAASLIAKAGSVEEIEQIINGEFNTRSQEKLSILMKGFYSSTYDLMGNEAIRNINEDEKKSAATELFNVRRERFLIEQGGRRITRMNAVTQNRIMEEVSLAVRDGEGTAGIARRIRGLVDKPSGRLSPRQRSFAIARTEVGMAASHAMRDGVESTGFKPKRKWLTFADGRERFEHRAANGQIREFDEEFDVGGEKLKMPRDTSGSAGNVINCRCQEMFLPATDQENEVETVPEPVGEQKPPFENVSREMFNRAPSVAYARGALSDRDLKGSMQDLYDITDNPHVFKNENLPSLIFGGNVSKFKRMLPEKHHGALGAYNSRDNSIGIKSQPRGIKAKGTFFHEYGHHLDFTFNRKSRLVGNKEIADEWKNALEKQKLKQPDFDNRRWSRAVDPSAPSPYALVNDREWFAEAFRIYVNGGKIEKDRLLEVAPRTVKRIELILKGNLKGKVKE